MESGRNIALFGILSLAMLFAGRAAAAYTVTRGPYLQMASHEAVTVRWRSAEPGDSWVWYGTTPGDLSKAEGRIEEVTDHEVRVTGLKPNTRYYYAVGNSQAEHGGFGSDLFFTTSPVPGDRGHSRIWVLGDSGTADANAAAVRDAYLAYAGEEPADLLLMLGDNADSFGTDAEYQAAMFEMYPGVLKNTAVWSTIGNHELWNGETFSLSEQGPYYEIFSFPRNGEAGGVPSGTEAYYSFDRGNIHIVVLNSEDISRAADGAMLTWLEEDLAATQQEWIIAVYHQPSYSKGNHDSDYEINMVEMRRNVNPLLEAAGVDLVLSGHSHSYERSYLLKGHFGGSDSFDLATMALDAGDGDPQGDGAYLKQDGTGTVYAVLGCSGKLKDRGSLDHPAHLRSLLSLGSLVIDVVSNRMDVVMLDDSGVVQDRFAIIHEGEESGDLDADGLEDWWERFYFGDLEASGSGNFDGDGSKNLTEFIAGTDPTDPSDFLRVESICFDPESRGLAMRWSGVPGRAYAVESLRGDGSGEWITLSDFEDNLATDREPMVYTHTGSLDVLSRYRLNVRRVD